MEGYTYEIEDKSNSQYEVKVKVTSELFKKEKEKTFSKLKGNVEIKGFRPGMAPKNLIEAKLGPSLYEETLNALFPKIAVEVLQKENLNPVNQVEYHLEKVGEDEGLHFHFHFEALGEVKLPDFKKLSVKKEKTDVTEKEVEEVIQDMMQREAEEKPKDNKKENKAKAKAEATDEWVKSLKIDKVTNVKELRDEVRKQIEAQKKGMEEERYITAILDKAIEAAKINVPNSLVEKDMEAREKNYKSRIETLGLEFDTFLKTRNVDFEKLKKEWREDTVKRIAREILLVEIAKKNEFKITDEDIDKEVSILNDPELKKQYSTQAGRNYIATVLIQQKAINWIREQLKA